MEEATTATNPIVNTSAYVANSTPKELFVRIQNESCYSITSFFVTTKNCPPTVYNFISANHDGANDDFYIDGLRNIFLNFKIEIYNRWGKLIWTGNQNTDNWDGTVKNGFEFTNAPDGTYFYLLFLNEMDYPEPLKGFLYLNH
jgi:gliding motility-associated-like protein